MKAFGGQLYDGAPPILIMGAMKVETAFIAEKLNNRREYRLGVWDFAVGEFDGVTIGVGTTSWGLANVAASLTLAMEFFRPRAVINEGTAGAHAEDLKRFDIVIGERTVNMAAWKTDFRLKGQGVDNQKFEKLGIFTYDREKNKFVQQVYHEADEKLLSAAKKVCGEYKRGRVTLGTIGTADSWNMQADWITFLRETFGTAAEEMEGDAAAQICAAYGVPFLDVRVISNSVFQGDEDWDTTVGVACQEFVLDIIKEYVK